VPDLRRAGAVFAIAAPLEISHVDYPAIAPQPQVFWVLQIYLFIHRVIGGEQKP
jgi:hypothetical protein